MTATAPPRLVQLPDRRGDRRRVDEHAARVEDAQHPDDVAGPLTRDELSALPPVLDVATAARVLGIGRTMAYELVRTGRWPSPVLRVGRLIKIPTASLLALLGERHP